MEQSTVGSRLNPGNAKLRIDLGYVQQRPGLHIQKCRVLCRVGDLENPVATIVGTQSKVLIPLTSQWCSGGVDGEGLLGDRFRLLPGKPWSRALQDCIDCCFRLGIPSGGHGFYLLCNLETVPWESQDNKSAPQFVRHPVAADHSI